MVHKFNTATNLILKFSKKKKLDVRTDFRLPNEKIPLTPKILLIATYPPRECGIASYTYDLKKALDDHFEDCFNVKVCALASENENHIYDSEAVECFLNPEDSKSYRALATRINFSAEIELVMVQHEFGLFKKNEAAFLTFLESIQKPIILAFHTILPEPNSELKIHVQKITSLASSVTVMTKSARELLFSTYGLPKEKVTIISHGTHLVEHGDKNLLKEKYGLLHRKVISTFGFLGPGKNIETTIEALPALIKEHEDLLFIIVGKTHPTLFKQEGDAYRESLKQRVAEMHLENYVKFINKYVPLPELLDYLQLSDCYVFTSINPNQAVSGTFSYALSCGCPIVSTPIPHAREVLNQENSVLFDFGNSKQLAEKLNHLLDDRALLQAMKMKALAFSSTTSWQNAAIAHAQLFAKEIHRDLPLQFKIPPLNTNHLKNMTTDVGMLQFSKITTPDLDSGYTLDDNARALIAASQHFKLTQNQDDFNLVMIYLTFILKCQRPSGLFLNYVDQHQKFTRQNTEVNLEDANGRAIWALGYVFHLLQEENELSFRSNEYIRKAVYAFIPAFRHFSSPRAIGFAIKGLYYFHQKEDDADLLVYIREAAQKLVTLYEYNADDNWQWFEPYLTYANSVLPEALLCAWNCTGEPIYKDIAKTSFDFLLSKIFVSDTIKVISNQHWLLKGSEEKVLLPGGEQPIDVAYTILALQQFSLAFPLEDYEARKEVAFSWFLGNNHLNQIVYNYCTGGCHDGIEERNVNLNQGAESTVSYLLARMAFEKLDGF